MKKFYITTAIDYIKEFWYNGFNGREKISYFQKEVKRFIL